MNMVYFWVGLIISNVILAILWALTGWLGKLVWNRITRIYSLCVITYWLQRLEKEGTHTFEKAKRYE